jgi:hypothetical protein
MLERLALVIHWIGFAIGALVGVFVLLVFMNEFNLALSGFVGALSFMVPHTCGWLVKFIFTGNGSFFPWQS